MGQVEGKVAIVTGGASGIGAACAATPAREGAKVVVTDLDDTGGRDLVDKINGAGGEAIFLHQDVSLEFADDEIAPALSFERLKELALNHLGGSSETDDVAVFNRLTGATMATHLTLVKPGEVVIGVSATHSHPSVVRAAGHVGARFIDTAGLGAFREAIATEHSVALVVLTRLAVTYDLLPLEAIETIVKGAHDKGALVYMDDAGGARVGPAAFGQPRTLELGVDIGATGLDKYGTKGPRFGLLAGRKDLVGRIRVKGFEFGMEARQMLYPAVARTLELLGGERQRVLEPGEDIGAARPAFADQRPRPLQLLEVVLGAAENLAARIGQVRRMRISKAVHAHLLSPSKAFAAASRDNAPMRRRRAMPSQLGL